MRALLNLRSIVRAAASVALATAVISTTACGKDDKSPTDNGGDNSIVGNYALTSVDGESLPVTVYDGFADVDGQQVAITIDLTAGTMNVKSNGTFTGSLTLNFSVDGGQAQSESLPVSGNYSVSGSTITFTPDDDEVDAFSAQIAGSQFAADVDLLDVGETSHLVWKK